MIVLIGASAIYLAATQAAIAVPTEAFRTCLHDASTKANNEKVASEAIDAYLRNACGAQMSSLKNAVVTFRMKNGMAKKAASSDADMTVDDYVATSVDKYQFMASMNAPAKPAPATPPQPTPAAVAQPPK